MGVSLLPAGTIGGITIHAWDGWIPDLQFEISDFARIGQTGSGAEITGTRAAKGTCVLTVFCGNLSTATSTAQSFAKLNGQPQAVTDALGRKMPRVRVEKTTVDVKACRGLQVSGSACTHRVVAKMVLEQLP